MTRTLVSAFQENALRHPQKVFWRHLSAGHCEEFTFSQVYDRARAFAAAYRDAGLQPGCVVLIFLPHHPDAAAAFLGAMLAGGVPSFMAVPSPRQHQAVFWPSHAGLLQLLDAPLVVTTDMFAAQMRTHGLAALAGGVVAVEAVGRDAVAGPAFETRADAVALLQHGSGTISRKKFVPMTHQAILRHVDYYAARLGMTAGDNCVNWLPLYHDIGLIAGTVAPMVLGQTVTCMSASEWVARPAVLFEALQLYDGHFTWMPNFAFELVEQAVPRDFAGDLSAVKAFINCGESGKPQSFHRFQQRFSRFGLREEQLQLCYAMAESVFAISQTVPGSRAGSVRLESEKLNRHGLAVDAAEGARATQLFGMGRPLPGIDVRINGADGLGVAENIVGEITLAGECLFSGYLNDPRTTFERFADGRFRTGDSGFMRDGELYVVGRKDDLVTVNGWKLFGQEVERIINELPGMKPWRSAAFGAFNRKTGSEDLVVIVEYDGADGPESDNGKQLGRAIREAVHDQTGIEVSVLRVEAPGWLVRNAGGRITRRASRTKYIKDVAASQAIAEAPSQGSATFVELAGIIAEHFNHPAADVHLGTVAGDVAGWHSLAHTTLMLELESAFGVRFDEAEMFGFVSVADLVRRIEVLRAEQAPSRPDRVMYRTNAASIVRFGAADSVTPDLVIFAGLAMKMGGGLDVMDFASVLAGTDVRNHTKYFITDRRQGFFLDCLDDVSAALNALSDKPKILIGNSMGGYGALLFAQKLTNVQAVLAFVPRTQPPEILRGRAHPVVRFRAGVDYSILYGEAEDSDDLQFLQQNIDQLNRQHLIMVRNCGHNLVRYLNAEGLLAPVLGCTADSGTMAGKIRKIVGQLPAKPELLRDLGPSDEDG